MSKFNAQFFFLKKIIQFSFQLEKPKIDVGKSVAVSRLRKNAPIYAIGGAVVGLNEVL